MEPGNSTTPSSASCELREVGAPSLELNLPDGDAFRSLPPRLSWAEWMERNQQLRRWFPAGLPSEEERWERKRPAKFRL
jgi:hypothetical protein